MMPITKEKILVVEDDQRLCRLISRYLERANYLVKTVKHGRELHQRLKIDRYNLILLDLLFQ